MSRAKKRVLLSWSSGKDSAWTLHTLLRDSTVEVVGLLSTINSKFDRVAMHGVRRSLLEQQAAAARLPLWVVPLPWPCSNQEYERIMKEVTDQAIAAGIHSIAFGDLFLEDVRRYREGMLAQTRLEPLFPLWKLPTHALARQMLAANLRARVTCVDPRLLPCRYAGREFDEEFLQSLPTGIDPCGENGEFHTFVYGGPMFAERVPVRAGNVVQRDGFCFADLLPESGEDESDPREQRAGRHAVNC